jgi:beta-glucanase (GH16 family)
VPAGGPTLLFSDEFNGSSIDTNKWTTGYWWDDGGCTNAGNNELEWYQPGNILVSNGTLKLQARKQTITGSDGKTYNYTSGMITSGRATWQDPAPDKFAFKYGYAEMRARVPKGKGLWPAFWLLSRDQDWPPEIDVMEIIGDQTNIQNMTVHFLNAQGVYGSHGGEWAGPDFSADWHTYAMDWQPNAIIWYVDGVERWRCTDKSHIPTETMYLLANLAVGGDWPGSPDASTVFPANFEIDYIRVWSAPPGSSGSTPTPTRQPLATPRRGPNDVFLPQVDK